MAKAISTTIDIPDSSMIPGAPLHFTVRLRPINNPMYITHNLGRFPSVTAIELVKSEHDGRYRQVEVQVDYLSSNCISVSWNGLFEEGWIYII